MRAVTADEMRRIESACVERGISLATLMQRAGTAVALAASSHQSAGPVLVLAGPGNNGGDGLVAARALRSQGIDVAVYTFRRRDLMDYEGEAVASEDDAGQARLKSLISSAGVVVDALLGIGQTRRPEGLLASIVSTCNLTPTSATRIAVDIPTGVDADTGAVLGPAFRADLTLCMGLLKVGAMVYPGAGHAGRADVVEMGIPDDLTADVGLLVPDARDIAAMLPARGPNSNKGTYGRVLIVGGSADFLGAPGLVSIAALRSGAGLAEVASIPDVCRNVASHALEPIYLPLTERDGHVARDAAGTIRSALPKVSSVVYGPGLGASEDVLALTTEVLAMLQSADAPPAVIDADGLNALSKIPEWWKRDVRLVLTPHPGEMSRLTGISTADIQKERLSIAATHATAWQKSVVLKGAGTLVVDPNGMVAINTTGSGNLATGGTGDVLSGIIGGLLAQGLDPWRAAIAGTYLHGKAGDMVAAQSGLSGTLASDLLQRIPLARKAILEEAGVMES